MSKVVDWLHQIFRNCFSRGQVQADWHFIEEHHDSGRNIIHVRDQVMGLAEYAESMTGDMSLLTKLVANRAELTPKPRTCEWLRGCSCWR